MSAGDILLLVLAGAGCGVVNTVAGGGSLILFPALLATGLAPLPANVSNSVATWPGYLGGVGAFRAEIATRRHLLPWLLGATLVGSTTGCVLLLVTPTAAFNVIVPILVLAASAMTALQPIVRRRLRERAGHDHRPSPTAVGSVAAATVYGGYFGGGLGVIVLGVLGLTIDDSVGNLTAIKSVISLVDASVSVIVFGLFGPVSWAAVAIAAPTCLLGGYLGGSIARRLDERVLRLCVVTLGVVVGIVLFFTL